MRLAADELTIRLNGETLFLRPSLRAAARLERQHGFEALGRGVGQGSITIITDIIREGTRRPEWTFPMNGVALVGSLDFKLALGMFIHMLTGSDLDEEATSPASDEAARITFAEIYEQLFRLATGWLGWTPSEALDATPNEIRHAHRGRVDMLKAIYGSAEKPKDTRSLGEKVRSAFAGRTTIVQEE